MNFVRLSASLKLVVLLMCATLTFISSQATAVANEPACRHQKTSPMLPEGSPLPDLDTPMFDPEFVKMMRVAKKDDILTLKLRVSTCDSEFIEKLKAFESLKVIAIRPKHNEVIVSTPSWRVGWFFYIKEILWISQAKQSINQSIFLSTLELDN